MMREIQRGHVLVWRRSKFVESSAFFRVLERRRGDVWISVPLQNSEIVDIKDFNVTIMRGWSYVDGTIEDGTDVADRTPRDVYLSPQNEFIYIQKHLNTTMNVGNIYRRRGASAKVIQVDGLRFDDACLHFYCRTRGIPLKPLTKVDGYSRDIDVVAWNGDHVGVFDVAASNSFYRNKPGDLSIFFRIYFDCSRERFLKAHEVRPWHTHEL